MRQEVENCMEELMEKILEKDNLNKAYLQVYRNKGSQGIDGMTVQELKSYLRNNGESIRKDLMEETYTPNPVLMVEIPKENGKERMLGIATVVDRVIQQSVSQVIMELIDKTFSDNSYGFRPNKSAHQAIKQANQYINEGYKYVVDIDLSQYFDTINHDKLMYLLTKEIKDSRVLRLIRKFLKGGIIKSGTKEETRVGCIQGGLCRARHND